MGINRYLVGILGVLVGSGAEVTVLTSPAHPVTLDNRYRVLTIGSHIQVKWEQIDLRRHLSDNSYDIYWAPANGGVPLFARRSQTIIVTEHDLIPLLVPRAWFPHSILWGISFFVQLATAMIRANHVVTDSHFSASMIRRWIRREAKVVYPVVDLKPLNTSVGLHSETPKPPYLLYHGGIGSRKRVDSAILACGLLRACGHQFNLVLLGRGYEVFDSLIANNALEACILRPGYVSENERDLWVSGAHAVLYPSEMEGFGLPVLEAMSQGVPVITAPNSSLLEVGGDSALYADPSNPAEIALRVIELEDPVRRDRAIALGHSRAQEYSSENTKAAVLAFVRSLLRAP